MGRLENIPLEIYLEDYIQHTCVDQKTFLLKYLWKVTSQHTYSGSIQLIFGVVGGQFFCENKSTVSDLSYRNPIKSSSPRRVFLGQFSQLGTKNSSCEFHRYDGAKFGEAFETLRSFTGFSECFGGLRHQSTKRCQHPRGMRWSHRLKGTSANAIFRRGLMHFYIILRGFQTAANGGRESLS